MERKYKKLSRKRNNGILQKNSQVSIEYLMIMGFVTLITIPLVIIYHTFTQDSSENINSVQLQQIAKKVVDAAESIYYIGEPSQTTIRVNIPNNVVLANLSSFEVVYRMKTRAGEVDIVMSSAVNLTGSLPTNKSTYLITVKAKGDHVEVSYK